MCYCDYERPTLYERRIVKGRKKHRCSECLRTIEKGEHHEYVKGLWEGCFSTFRTCDDCTKMIKEVKIDCYSHGQLMEVLDERDYPLVESVVNFQKIRHSNWMKINGKE